MQGNSAKSEFLIVMPLKDASPKIESFFHRVKIEPFGIPSSQPL